MKCDDLLFTVIWLRVSVSWSLEGKMSVEVVKPHPHLLLYIMDGKFPWETSREPSPSSSSLEMDPELWSQLPAELLEKVLDWVMLVLPYPCQLRCRVVSKTWYRRLTSPNVPLASVSLALPAPPMVWGFEYRYRYSGEPQLRKTGRKAYEVGLSFLPARFQVWRSRGVVANDGLICLELRKQRHSRLWFQPPRTVELFCVLNPITRTWRHVPELDTNYRALTAMQVQADKTDQGCFKVYAVMGDTLNTYFSRTDTWKISPVDPAPGPRCVFLNNLIYSFDSKLEEMTVLDLEDGHIVKHGNVGKPVADFQPMNFPLVHHQGTVYFAGRTYRRTTDPWLVVWRLDEAKMAWEEISVLPVWIYDKLVKSTVADCDFSMGDASVMGDSIHFTISVRSIPKYGYSPDEKLESWSHIITYHIPTRNGTSSSRKYVILYVREPKTHVASSCPTTQR